MTDVGIADDHKDDEAVVENAKDADQDDVHVHHAVGFVVVLVVVFIAVVRRLGDEDVGGVHP